MKLEIRTQDEELADAFESSAPFGVSVTIRHRSHRGAKVSDVFIVSLEFIKSAATPLFISLFAAWHGKIAKDKPCQITHRGRDVKPEEESIRRLIKEELEIGKND